MGEVDITKIDQWLAILNSKVEYLQYCLDRKKIHIEDLDKVLNTYVLTGQQRNNLIVELEKLNREFIYTRGKLSELKINLQELELSVPTREEIKKYEKIDEVPIKNNENQDALIEEVGTDYATNHVGESSPKDESINDLDNEKDYEERNIEEERGIFSSFLNKFRRFKNNE